MRRASGLQGFRHIRRSEAVANETRELFDRPTSEKRNGFTAPAIDSRQSVLPLMLSPQRALTELISMVRDKSNGEPADSPNPGTSQAENLSPSRSAPSTIASAVVGTVYSADPSANCGTNQNRLQLAGFLFRL
jgi:hypothetical protein